MGNTVQLLKDGQPVFPVTDVSLVMGLQDAIKLPPVKVTTLPTASASTAGKMYYVGPDGNDEYERYITSAVGGSYSWIDLGDTSIPLPSIADNLTTADANTALSANQGVVLAGQIGQLDQKVTKKIGGSITPSLSLEQGAIGSTTGLDAASTTRIRTANYIRADKIKVTTSGNKVYVMGYTEDGTYISAAGWLTTSQDVTISGAVKYRLVFAYSNDATIVPTDFSSLSVSIVAEFEGDFATTELVQEKLDKQIGTNLVNPEDITTGAALSWSSTSGQPYTGVESNYVVSGFIPVDGKDIISNAFSKENTWASMFIYDANRNFLRHNGTSQQYTYQAGDAYVRISWKSSSISNWKANYGTTLADYSPYTDYKPLQDLDVRVTAIEEQVPSVNPDYTSIALFKSAAVVGDSYSSGAIYLGGSTDGAHYEMSWLKIMSRKNGLSTGIYATPAQNTTKFLDPTDSRYNSYGLGALLADTAKDLYFIMLGINAEPDGVSIGTIADCNVDWSQNAASFYGNYGKIIGNIKTHAPNAKIVCIVADMLFSNLNPATGENKRNAIKAVAEFYEVPYIEASSNAYFSSQFYVSCLRTNHPVGITYAGMANAFEKIFAQCVQAHSTYFLDYVNQ